jgi:DnaJ family protein C protein 28
MDFIDWRKVPDKIKAEAMASRSDVQRLRAKRLGDYIEEQIREAQERGEFDNLPGTGKPLALDDHSYAGDNALAYHLLKSNGFAPPEIELVKEIRDERARIEARLEKLVERGKALRARRILPFASEKRAFNTAVKRAAEDYERTLRELNRKILVFNLSTPPAMHQPFLEVERLVQDFRQACPLFSSVAARD